MRFTLLGYSQRLHHLKSAWNKFFTRIDFLIILVSHRGLLLRPQVNKRGNSNQVIETEKQRDRETDRLRDRETERQRDRETERQRDRETEKQRDRQTDRQTDWETKRDIERQRETERDRETERQTGEETTTGIVNFWNLHAYWKLFIFLWGRCQKGSFPFLVLSEEKKIVT